MQQLTKYTADLAQSLLTLRNGRPFKTAEIDSIELLAQRVLKEVSAVRRGDSYEVGEMTGQWRAYNPSRQ